jgi:hypothetical protein
VNCELACHLMDEYLEKRLSRYDARRLERHLNQCQRCRLELQERPVFERTIRCGLASSVQHRHLSPESSMRIVREVQGNLRRAIWSNRVSLGLRVAAGVAAVALVLVGLFSLLSGMPGSSGLGTITLFPIKQLALAEPEPITRFTANQPTLAEPQPGPAPTEHRPAIFMGRHDVRIEPWRLESGEPFTITMFLHTNLPQTVNSARFDLDVTGPTGYYRFEMAVKGPLPPQGISVLELTPEDLAASSRERYLLSPTEIFAEPGVYTIRVFLFSPVLASLN